MKALLNVQELFKKYLNNACSAEEIQQLLTYFDQEQNEAALRALILDALEAERDLAIINAVDTAAVWRVREALIESVRKNNIDPPLRRWQMPAWLKYAAFWFLLAWASALLIHRYWEDIHDVFHPIKMKIAYAPRGVRKQVTLADGSKIWLSPSSSLAYPDQFKGNLREVKLEGEAFFEVAKDKIHPFIIHNGKMSVRVVGTEFLIQGFNAQPAVTVVSGIVKVSAAGRDGKEKTVILHRNFRSTFNPGNGDLLTVLYPEATKLLKRKRGILTYEGTPARDVLADFSRAYNREIIFDNNVRECVCYGDFDTNRPIEISLTQLAAAINAKLVMKGGKYIIKGGCDER